MGSVQQQPEREFDQGPGVTTPFGHEAETNMARVRDLYEETLPQSTYIGTNLSKAYVHIYCNIPQEYMDLNGLRV